MRTILVLSALTLALVPILSRTAEAQRNGGFGPRFNPPGIGGTRPFVQDRSTIQRPAAPSYRLGEQGAITPGFNNNARLPLRQGFNNSARP